MEKIEYYESHEKVVRKEEWIKGENKVEKTRVQLQSEIDRLTVMINLYKEKLNRRETENRNLLVELKIYKEKILTIKEYEKEIARLLEIIKRLEGEIKRLKGEWSIKESNYLSEIEKLRIIIE